MSFAQQLGLQIPGENELNKAAVGAIPSGVNHESGKKK